MSRRLNLATKPFVNESLPGLVVGLAAALTLGATLYHGLVLSRLLSPTSSARAKEVSALETELLALRKEAPALRAQRAEPGAVKEWGYLREIVDRRALGWTDLFARLEEVLPRNVKLVSVAPTVSKGVVKLELTALARSPEDGFDFARRLQARPEFVDAVPTSVADNPTLGGSEFRYSMRYMPERAGAPTPSASPSPAESGEESHDEAEPAASPPPRSGPS